MHRRNFLLTTAGAAFASGAPASKTTVLYGDNAITLEKVRPDPKDLWVRKSDLPRVNGFEVKPQGACREDVCIPIPKTMQHGGFFNLSAFARKTGETVGSDSG